MVIERIITLGIQAKIFAGGTELQFHSFLGWQPWEVSFIPYICADLKRINYTLKGKALFCLLQLAFDHSSREEHIDWSKFCH